MFVSFYHARRTMADAAAMKTTSPKIPFQTFLLFFLALAVIITIFGRQAPTTYKATFSSNTEAGTAPTRPVEETTPSKPAPKTTPKYNYTCEDSTHAIDPSSGKPCVNFQKVLKPSLIYVADDSSYMVCAIPKNGCSYHLALMNRIAGVKNYESMYEIHDKERKGVIKLISRSTEEIVSLLRNENLPKYLVVRNPLRRTLSAYLDKVYNHLPDEKRKPEHFHAWVYEEFPKVRMATEWVGINPHWRSQLQFCGFRVKDVHTYFKRFRVEQPEDYVDFLYRFIPSNFLKDGWRKEENLSFREHILGPRKRTTNTGNKFAQFFSRIEVFDHLALVLKEDIVTLGYSEEVKDMREELVKVLSKDSSSSLAVSETQQS